MELVSRGAVCNHLPAAAQGLLLVVLWARAPAALLARHHCCSSCTHPPLPPPPPPPPQFYIKKGLLFPAYHKAYWFGLYTDARAWKTTWKYTDLSPFAYSSSYANWGISAPEGLTAPNNISGQEFCGAANASEATNAKWGWEDYNCLASLPFMCEIPREWQRTPRSGSAVTAQHSATSQVVKQGSAVLPHCCRCW